MTGAHSLPLRSPVRHREGRDPLRTWIAERSESRVGSLRYADGTPSLRKLVSTRARRVPQRAASRLSVASSIDRP
jgi:hypothetical protein